MLQHELLTHLIDALDASDIRYMITGSFASGLQGHIRTTHDIDVVVDLKEADVDHLRSSFPESRFFFEPDDARAAIRERRMFNVIDGETGMKVDFWPLKDNAFDRSCFERRTATKFIGRNVVQTAPEDTILSKLRWTKMIGGSEKHMTDALRVFEVQGEALDRAYIEKWVKELKVKELWHQLLEQAT